MQVYCDLNGKSIRLGKQVGQGGEASVYESLSDPSKVVKIYHVAPDRNHLDKLSALIELSHPEIVRFAAWPYSVVRKSKWETPIGFVMPRATGKVIHNLYTPSSRKLDFPNADWRFLVRTASNFATAVETLHNRGIVIGDINQGNVLVSDDALVRFIDCDSFQIKRGGSTFRCPVGVPHFTPPELHSSNFSQSNRTQNHDRFGLAVMIFHLLFVGRHPFAGRFSGHPDRSLEDRIKEYRFAFGRDRKQLQMEPPPNSLLLTELSGDIAVLFERAFVKGSENDKRPTAADWRFALKKFESSLVECKDDPGHYYNTYDRCPWCRIVNEGGPNFFVSVSDSRIQDQFKDFDLEKFVGEICAIPLHLRSTLQYNPRKLVFDPDSANGGGLFPSTETLLFIKVMIGVCLLGAFFLLLLRVFSGAIVFGIASMLMTALLVYLLLKSKSAKENREKFSEQEKIRINKLRADFDSRIREAEDLLKNERGRLLNLASEIRTLDNPSPGTYGNVSGQVNQNLLDQYLSRIIIRDSKIRMIGRRRAAELERHGIRTAYDIERWRIATIPGIRGQALDELMDWKKQRIRDFQSQNSNMTQPGGAQKVGRNYIQNKTRMIKQLREGFNRLEREQKEHRALLQAFLRKERLT